MPQSYIFLIPCIVNFVRRNRDEGLPGRAYDGATLLGAAHMAISLSEKTFP